MKVLTTDITAPSNVLRPINELDMELLRESLIENGQLTAITICDGQIVDGYRRWLVARELGWKEIEAHTVEGDPDRLRVICQTRTSAFGLTERKLLVGNYLERFPAGTAGDIAHHFKWSTVEVENLVGVMYVIPEAISLYKAGTIPLLAMWHLSRVKDHIQLKLLADPETATLVERAEAELRETRAARRRSMSLRPRMKSFNLIEKESINPSYAGPELISSNAQTPLDGWKAALAWVIRTK